ncbi:transmembrane protein 97 [Rhinolophus ferrumequinum]|uniref:Transmembrane protein 97 n=1 Tax=Rhinolophus ferrumequinum TaxID=59479 RepID=A0A7J7TGX8_RHIFE|nr:transmembrane protein 97 [Rhinolophus ferrumequinum]
MPRSSKTLCYKTPHHGLNPSCSASLCFSCLSFPLQHMPSSKEAASGSASPQSSTRFTP